MQAFACAHRGVVITSRCRCVAGRQVDGRWALAEQVIRLGRITHPRPTGWTLEDPQEAAPLQLVLLADGRPGALMANRFERHRIVGSEVDRPRPIVYMQTQPRSRRAARGSSRIAVLVGLGLAVAAAVIVYARSPM